MKLIIETNVDASLKDVQAGFTSELFVALNPPFPPVELVTFGGFEVGDIVELKLKFPFFHQTWKSIITENEWSGTTWYFVDVGVKLPFFLQSWKHQHKVESHGVGSKIIDNIDFNTPFRLTDWLMYPILKSQFLYRKPIYRKFFKKKAH